MDPRLKQEILSILDEANDMTIATVRKDGYPQATTVSYINDGLKIYFGCAANSQKASQTYLKFPDQPAWVSLSVG
jgi:nitroimidazol reductase NimA-like FMN-containing flavoprotein (pyridoxamine 5'-phosphate oxidase superfamily)